MSDRVVPVRRVLISVSDKSGLEQFGRALSKSGVTLISTGGTARALRDAGLEVRDVSDVTGFPEIMDGRVKTLHPAVHAGLLAVRSNADHRAALETNGIEPIDLVVVNLYPFEETIAAGAAAAEGIENIDIGGPAMIRAAAKNHGDVAVIVDPADYESVSAEIAAEGGTAFATRQRLAAKAFARTSAYDAAVAAWFAMETGEDWPQTTTIAGRRVDTLRYGENPHQSAAFYATSPRSGLAGARQVQGKALSYNNINDADAALELAADLDAGKPSVANVKHANPCGVAVADSLLDAHAKAHA